ncbi:MAG: hypothetical protein CM1200mP20_06170 [Pseudomonadota bacterium]|nr:MAG: hypothetical protein CM1200mP20_06170 [Pseudomonadota bacterium]
MNSRNLMTAIAIVTGLVGVASLIVPLKLHLRFFHLSPSVKKR